ncbi:MAG: hypothetical protein ACKPKO_10705, partial [Candidatus Fonsibacter sp.]
MVHIIFHRGSARRSMGSCDKIKGTQMRRSRLNTLWNWRQYRTMLRIVKVTDSCGFIPPMQLV